MTPPATEPEAALGKALFIARQPGTAAAFESLLTASTKRSGKSGASLLVLPDGVSGVRGSYPVQLVADIAEAAATAVARRPSCAVTGTSLQAEEDAALWRMLRELELPVFAYLDSWTNYARRFPHGAIAGLTTLPDACLVPDDRAAAELRAIGFPANRILICGLLAVAGIGTPEARLSGDGTLRILFATEPTPPDDEGRSHALVHGYDEPAAFHMLVDAIDALPAPLRNRVWVDILPHPRQRAGQYPIELRLANRDRFDIAIDTKDRLLQRAACVVAMRSMVLHEAAMMGIPALSFQPFRRTASDITDRRPGIIVVTEPDDATRRLANTLRLSSRRRTKVADIPSKFAIAIAAAMAIASDQVDRAPSAP